MNMKRLKTCRGCGVVYKKSGGFGSWCSPNCRLNNPRMARGCKPNCLERSLSLRDRPQKGGGIETLRVCSVCNKFEIIGKKMISNLQHLNYSEELSERYASQYKENFYHSTEWLKLRYRTLIRYGKKCMVCGSLENIQVDHIKPRSKHPRLGLEFNNLQVLCRDCNFGKSNTDETDWRDSALTKV